MKPHSMSSFGSFSPSTSFLFLFPPCSLFVKATGLFVLYILHQAGSGGCPTLLVDWRADSRFYSSFNSLLQALSWLPIALRTQTRSIITGPPGSQICFSLPLLFSWLWMPQDLCTGRSLCITHPSHFVVCQSPCETGKLQKGSSSPDSVRERAVVVTAGSTEPSTGLSPQWTSVK